MPNFHRVRDPRTGGHKMVLVSDPVDVQPIALQPPPSVTLEGGRTVYKCKLCTKIYRGQGVFAIHFGHAHKDVVVDKNTWRTYVENVHVPAP